jgi:hypothetical protein
MFQKPTRADLERYRAVGRFQEYVDFLGELKKGEGARIDVAVAGVGRQSVKNRVSACAAAAGVEIKYLRSGADSVVFEVVGTA